VKKKKKINPCAHRKEITAKVEEQDD